MLDSAFLKEFGVRLNLFRIKKDMSQAQLGEMINISEHRISQIENGKCNITLKTINKISNALNIPAVKLFTFD